MFDETINGNDAL